ncbi:hypothetical protein HO133_003135 [Letharia lupina]|uniref:Uncharacterized protein n=1 Tax=Letharia lupina TaxID=560253 RepID=A0A8H6F9X2_9LECA|nr:uncharacterized protein HO133_003135 [Letharia lupina]KAF6220702.1 hypothetical protein HO133_003135 [Letharia lupina]
MALLMSPEFLMRHLSPMHVAVPIAATLLGVAANYGPRMFASPAIEVIPQEIGEFAFHNGVLIPHQDYLYGSSETGEPFIVGKKLAGQDYSAWEAGYEKFAKLESLTFVDSGSKSTWSWSFEEPKASTSSDWLKLLLWLIFGTMCLLMLSYLVRKIVSRFSCQNRKNKEGILANPTSDIDAENAKLNLLWRTTLISMYRERKSENLLLKSALETLKAEHADKFAEQQREMDNLRQMLDTQKKLAQNLENSDHAVAAENTTTKDPLGGGQPESDVMPEEAVAGSQDGVVDLPVESSEGEHAMAEAGSDDDEKTGAIEQDDDTPALDNESPGPKLGKNGKPRIPRANRRADGSIRTPSHPDYVPLEEAPSRLGDRPFRGPGRGNGWKRRRGGGGGWNDGARFGWIGGRGGGGGGGTNWDNGQSSQGSGH